MKREHPHGFKRNTIAFPELNTINKAAYWDYQRERVYVKSICKFVNAYVRFRPQEGPKGVIPNKTSSALARIIVQNAPRPSSTRTEKPAKQSMDIKFMQTRNKKLDHPLLIPLV